MGDDDGIRAILNDGRVDDRKIHSAGAGFDSDLLVGRALHMGADDHQAKIPQFFMPPDQMGNAGEAGSSVESPELQ
jgi:hypothetical protein